MHNHTTPQPRARPPVALVLIVAGLALLIVAGILGWLAWQFERLDAPTQDALRVAVFALPLLAAAGAAFVAGAIAWRRWADRELLKADRIVELTRAQRPFPDSLASLTYHDSHKALPAPPIEPLALPPPALPGPLDLAALDVRPTPSRILLGVDERGPITVSIGALCHVALVGSTGGGKSNLLRVILPQLLSIGASVALADPHYAPLDMETGEDWRAIEQRLRFAPAIKARAIDELLDFLTEELARRLERRNRGEKVGKPLFLAFDELPTIADMLPDAVPRIGKLLREGRKVGLLTVGASQSMLIKEVGGSSTLRDQYRTSFYVGGDRKSASALLDLAERLIDDGPLGGGVALLRSEATKPARLVRVPLASNEAIASLLGGETLDESSTVNRPSFGFRAPPKIAAPEGPVKVEESRLEPAERQISESPQTARIMGLFRQGLSIAEIVRTLTGASGGATYNRTRAEVEAVIRAALEGAVKEG